MRHSHRSLRCILVAATLLSGCAAAAPMRAQYLLRSDMPADGGSVRTPARVGIGRVTVAPYLDQSALVVETETREIRPARYHHWAEPLDSGLALFLRAQTAAALGEPVGIYPDDRGRWQYTVDVFVEQLHGTLAGEAFLVAVFRIVAAAEADAEDYRFTKRTALESDGYAALVDAEARLATDLAGAIAAALREQGLAAR